MREGDMLKLTSLSLVAGALLISIVACDNYSHNSIVNTPPTNYINLTMVTTYGGSGYDWGTSVVANSSDEYIVTGSTTSNGYGENTVYLSKSDAAGNRLWYNFIGGFGNDIGEAVIITPDGSILVAGVTSSWDLAKDRKVEPNLGEMPDDTNFYVIRTDMDAVGPIGVQEKAYGDTDYVEWGTSVAVGSDGYVFAGYQIRSEEEADFYFVKTDTALDLLWQKSHGTADLDRAVSIVATTDGGYVAGGMTSSISTRRTSPYLVKINGDGDVLWERVYPDDNNNRYIASVIETRDGGLACVGTSRLESSPPIVLAYVLKTSSTGEVMWQNTYSESRINVGRDILEKPDGSLLICGQNSSANAIYVADIGESGNLIWCDSTVITGYGMSMAPCASGYVLTGSTAYPDHTVLNDVLLIRMEEDKTNVE